MGTPTSMNEDRFVAAHKTFAVIDGATDTTGNVLNGMTPGAFVADYVHRTLTNLAQDPAHAGAEASLLMAGINRAFGDYIKQNHPERIENGFHLGPYAHAAFLRLHNDETFSYANAGDCFLVILYTDGTTRVCPPEEKPDHLEKDRLAHFMTLYKKTPGSFQDIVKDPEAKEIYRKDLEKLNRDISVINGDPNMENLVSGGRESLEDVAAFVLMSDGMFMPGLPDPEGAHMAAKKMLEHGLSAYARSVEAMYDNDPEREEFPRFKHRDDMTALVLNMHEIKQN